MCLRAALVAALCAAGAVQAQERITADEFLDRAIGRTLHFHMLNTGQLVGIEEFLRRDLTVWKPRGQACVYGVVTIEEGQLCFLYDNETPDEKSCWYTFDLAGQLLVRGIETFGAEVQVVEKITRAPISCPNKPTS